MDGSQGAAKGMASARQVGLFFVLKHIQTVIDLIDIVLDASQAAVEGFEEFFVLRLLCCTQWRLALGCCCWDGGFCFGVEGGRCCRCWFGGAWCRAAGRKIHHLAFGRRGGECLKVVFEMLVIQRLAVVRRR